MHKLLCLFCISMLSLSLNAQTNHEVSGIVKDSTALAVPSAVVTLTSPKDTLRTVTNHDGIFVFKNVHSAQFLLTIKSLGSTAYNNRFFYNDKHARIVLEPIILRSEVRHLEAVNIHGTPAITYKQDTIEFRASDYKVRENATADELLKKMEGIEVDRDGTVTAQGTEVSKARLNGRDYSGGNVANAIQNLPADIIEKIQIIDDYGDQAARTGIKEGDPDKVLNIVTKEDRSVGNIARLNSGLGSDDRYSASIFGNRLDGNQQINTIANLTNAMIPGIRGSNTASAGRGTGPSTETSQSNGPLPGASGGITTLGRGSIGYRDDWGEKMKFNSSYSFNSANTNSTNSIYSERLTSLGLILANTENNADKDIKRHAFNLDFEYEIDKSNYFRFQPSISYNSTLHTSDYSFEQTGVLHQTNSGITSNLSETPKFGGALFYQHLFKKPGRSLSFNLTYNRSDQQEKNEQDIKTQYYDDETDVLRKDSLSHLLIQRQNLSNALRQSTTFSERLNARSGIDFNAQINYRTYDNNAFTENLSGGESLYIDALSNAYQYAFTETRFSLNYRRTGSKYNLSLGVTAIPTVLAGTSEELTLHTRLTDFFVVPIIRFDYQFSRVHYLGLNYSGATTEPTFEQIQPFRDVSNPNYPVVGNPNLKPSFNHLVSLSYNNYIANSRLNYSLNLNASLVDNSIISGLEQIRNPYGNFVNEISFMNINGVSTLTANYNISKALSDRKYSIGLNGSVIKKDGFSVSNDLLNASKTWTFNQRLGLQINPLEWLELNPNLNYTYSKANYSFSDNSNSTRNVGLHGDGRIYIGETNMLSFNISKNYISGFDFNGSTNPFVINAAFEKHFFKGRNGVVSVQVFDLLDQNNFIERVYDEQGFTDTISNTLGQYFMVSFRLMLQKWTGTPSSKGKPLLRRGDGSFF